MQALAPTLTRTETKDWTTIKHMAKANNFLHKLIQNPNSQLQQRLNNPDQDSNTTQNSETSTTFTY